MGDVAGRNIILLSDGTGNSAGKLFKTNVWRLYDALDQSNSSQIAFYDDGVGTSSIKPFAILGGAFGWGLKRNVLALYTFLCGNYRPGDKIYGFGFSRGAFTIRVLIKFVLSQGLVDIKDATSNDDLRRKALRLYRNFRVETTKHYGLHTLARPLRDGAVWLWDRIFGRTELRDIKTVDVPEIEFLGLWDTVDAYGLPIEELENGVDRWIWPLSLDDKTLDDRIKKACHALSIDDRRTTFHPLLWDESNSSPVEHTDEEKLTQVWFAGVHANVGGGYPDDGLSYVPLRWMINEAKKAKLQFNHLAVAAIDVKVAPYGRIYNSRAGLGAYYRFDPRRLDPPRDRQGACIPHPKIHETVLWRMAVGADGYAPLSLPNELRVVTDSRTEHDASDRKSNAAAAGDRPRRKPNCLTFDDYRAAVQQDGDLFGAPAGPAASREKRERAAAEIGALTMPDDKTLDLMWDMAWWRRIAFFTTLISTALLLLFPALVDADIENLEPSLWTRPAGWATALLPTIARPWIESFEVFPIIVSTLVAITALSFGWGAVIDRRIHDLAIAAWNTNWRAKRYIWFKQSIRARYAAAALLLTPFLLMTAGVLYFAINENDSLAWFVFFFLGVVFLVITAPILAWWFWLWRIKRKGQLQGTEVRGPALWLAYQLRTSPPLTGVYGYAARHILPTAFAFGLVASFIFGLSEISFDFMDSGGSVCTGARTEPLPKVGKIVDFDVKHVCQPTGVRLAAKVKYRIEITEPKDWRDGEHIVGPQGFSTLSIAPEKFLVLPLRRKLTSSWFVPIARIGETGNEEYVLTTGTNEITPKRSAELFLYVNQAVIGLPGLHDYFYDRSEGTAKIKITAVGDTPQP